jgi:SET domain-containing protein
LDTSKVYVAACHLGKGVFASSRIAKGETIFVFTGKFITLDDAVAKGDHEGDVLQIGPGLYLDPQSPGLYINHSCAPNAGIRASRRVVALRDIEANEEVYFDYSTTMSEDRWTMRCDCRKPGCRGVIEDFHTLPTAVQDKYLAMGIVSDFIVRELQQGIARRRPVSKVAAHAAI